MYKLYGSNSAFLWGRLTFTDSKAGCLRAILLQSRGVREGEINPVYKTIGALNEEWHGNQLEEAGTPYERELPITGNVSGYSDVIVSGRIDYVVPSSIHELKAVTSYAKAREVIDQGNWKPEHLAQLVCYMVLRKSTEGALIYSFWKDKKVSKSSKVKPISTDKNDYELVSNRCYSVNIDDFGRIIIDGIPSKFTVYDQLAHQVTAAKVITEGEVFDRPIGWDAVFGSPCNYCPFKLACNTYDENKNIGTDAYVELAKKCLTTISEKGKEKDE